MIDTVVITLHETQFKIFESCYGSFSPDVRNFFHPPFVNFGAGKHAKATRNPLKYEISKRGYLPRLTLWKGVHGPGVVDCLLHVEFSVPKLVYGNNFDEIDDSPEMFDYICQSLAGRLLFMGVCVDKEVLKHATVKTIHYGKNVVLTDHTRAGAVVRDIAMCNVTTQKQADIQRFKNGGEVAHFYNSSSAFVAYDKLSEMDKAKRTTKDLVERDYECQLTLFDDVDIPSPFEVLRIEQRYTNKKAIRVAYKAINVDLGEAITFDKLFSLEYAKKIMLYEFGRIKSRYPAVLLGKPIPAFIADLQIKNPDITSANLMKIAGYKMLLDTGITAREVRNIYGFTSSQWSRFNAMMNKLDMTKIEHNGFACIDEALDKFKPIRLEDYFENMKGNDIL